MAEFKSQESKFEEASFDEEIICEEGGSAEDTVFDRIVGALEEILLDEDFSSQQANFCRRHCEIFEDSDENKFEYTAIFTEYTALIEGLLNEKLSEKIEGFQMDIFERMLVERKDEISGEIFDILLSIGDFDEFKQMMISQKVAREEQKDGECLINLTVSGSKVT